MDEFAEFDDWDEGFIAREHKFTDEAVDNLKVISGATGVLSPERTRRYYGNIWRRADGFEEEMEL